MRRNRLKMAGSECQRGAGEGDELPVAVLRYIDYSRQMSLDSTDELAT
jgi:hypothetical protein